MSVTLSDILKALDGWMAWGRIKATPDRLDALEQRIAALERRSITPARKTGEACPFCNGEMRLKEEEPDRHFGAFGVMQRTYECEPCGKLIPRKYDPRKD